MLAHSNSKINGECGQTAENGRQNNYIPTSFLGTYGLKNWQGKITLNYFGAGHTNGDSLIHFEHNDVVHMGDLMFNRRYPFIDRSAGANIKSWISILEKADKNSVKKTIFIFGHTETASVTGSKETQS